ncbi:MAG: hypothetical protein QOG23_3522 [Blastocatellia bacterium]|nr:hypothetical protein [Blastocatellia bacterium]
MLLGLRLDLLTSIEGLAKRRGSRATTGRVQPKLFAITRDSNDVYTISSIKSLNLSLRDEKRARLRTMRGKSLYMALDNIIIGLATE